MATRRNLTAGPSKFDLMLSVFDSKMVTFTMEGLGQVEGIVMGVTAQDPDHEMYQIIGYFVTNEGHMSTPFDGHFDSQTRKGFIETDLQPPPQESGPCPFCDSGYEYCNC